MFITAAFYFTVKKLHMFCTVVYNKKVLQQLLHGATYQLNIHMGGDPAEDIPTILRLKLPPSIQTYPLVSFDFAGLVLCTPSPLLNKSAKGAIVTSHMDFGILTKVPDKKIHGAQG